MIGSIPNAIMLGILDGLNPGVLQIHMCDCPGEGTSEKICYCLISYREGLGTSL